TAGAFLGSEAKVTESSITFTAPLNEELRRLMHESVIEEKGLHVSGSLPPCASAESVSLVIVTRSSPELDPRRTVFAPLGTGGQRLKGAEVPALAGFGVFFPRVKPELS